MQHNQKTKKQSKKTKSKCLIRVIRVIRLIRDSETKFKLTQTLKNAIIIKAKTQTYPQEHSNEQIQTSTIIPKEKAHKTNDSLVHHTTHRYPAIIMENIGHHFNVQSLMQYRNYKIGESNTMSNLIPLRKKSNIITKLTLALLLYIIAITTASAQDKLIIISPHPESIETEFGTNFEKWYKEKTGKTVETDWRDLGGTSSNYRHIDSEFKRVPDGIGIDIFFGGGTDNYLRLADKNLLVSYKLPEKQLEQIPQNYNGIPVYDAKHRWYGTALSSFGIMYNEQIRQLLKLPKATKWEDLGNTKLINNIGAADPRESGSAHMMYEIILQTHGWQNGFALLTKLGGNVKKFTAGSNEIPRDIVNGDVIYGLAIDFYAYSQIVVVGKDKIKYVLPEDGTVVNPDSIAILKGAPNLEIAKMFLQFVLSEQAQKLWMLRDTEKDGPKWKGGLNRGSVLPELYDKLGERCVVTNPFTLKNPPFPYDANTGSTRWDIVNDLFGTLIIDSHKDLVDAWKAIGKCKDEEKQIAAIATLVEMPLTEAEAMNIAKTQWNDQVYRNQKLKEWGQFAKQKYKKAKNLAK